ncbi:MAG: hypothetical protein ABSH09_27005 [Bryobacteraceae bacterium]|jgi:hypothetical protein
MKRPDIIRTAEEVGLDLAKGLQFSIEDLQSYRKGILPARSFLVLLRKVAEPALIAAALILLPLFAAAYFSSSSQGVSLAAGFGIVINAATHIKETADSSGWFRTILYFVGGLGCAGAAVYYATKIPLALYFDVLAKQVWIADGRVTAREEEKPAKGKRDEVITYYFDMKDKRFEVPRIAFNAIDTGGAYRVYYLPRSGVLVAIEPSTLAREAEERERRLATGPVARNLI